MQKIAKTTYGDVEYRIEGNGQSVVLVLNGGHCSNCNSPIPFLPFLMKQGFQVLIPSRPGYGNTPSSSGKTAETFAEALIELIANMMGAILFHMLNMQPDTFQIQNCSFRKPKVI